MGNAIPKLGNLIHEYIAELSWLGEGALKLCSGKGEDVKARTPKAFGNAHNPEAEHQVRNQVVA